MTNYIGCPSTLMNNDSSPNLYYDKVDVLFDAADPDFLEKVGLFIDAQRERGVEDFEIVGALMEKFGDEVDALIDLFEDTPECVQPLPPAPSPVCLYSRVDAVPILDVGSGNCGKLSTSQSKIIATDLVPQENAHYPVVELDASGPDFEAKFQVLSGNDYRVVTSFNSLSAIKDVEGVMECDGIHLYPDLEYLKKFHGAQETDGGVVVGKYRDFYNQATLRGDVVAPGYKMLTTFRRAKFRFKAESYTHVQPFDPWINTVHYMKDVPCSPKYDGLAMMLHSDGGRCSLRVRSGAAVLLQDQSPSPAKFTLMLEKLPKTGPAQAYVLLRVVEYNGWFPYHGLDSLKMFCEQIKVKIDDVVVRSPCHGLLARFPTDGLIFRENEQDYRFKDVLAVDLLDPGCVVKELRDQFGIDIELKPYPIDDNLKEFNIRCIGGGRYVMEFVCHRLDKQHGDSLEKIVAALK